MASAIAAELVGSDDNSPSHHPDCILNPSFIDLFIEEAPPQWTIEDLHVLSQIRNETPSKPAPFQTLPVELIEHISWQLINFRDIKSLANSCSIFRKILFESSNHLFWYKWAKAPHSMCRWDLGHYRQNRAYQNTIVRQQSGRRRKRCEKCMAKALNGLAFKKKTCMDCWEDIGIPANELFFLNQIDLSAIPREHVKKNYLSPATAEAWSVRREWDLLFLYRPGRLHEQLSSSSVQIAREDRPSELLEYAKKFIRDMASEISQMKRNMAYRYTHYAFYKTGANVRRENWYAPCVENLICPAEVMQRMFEQIISKDIGTEWLTRGKYRPLHPPAELYGAGSMFFSAFPKVDCELQEDEEWRKKFGEDLDNLHDCNVECKRKKKGKKFKDLWWPQAEDGFLNMLAGEASIDLTREEIAELKVPGYVWQWRDEMQKIFDEMLLACKWIVPGVRGKWTEESLIEWEKFHGKSKDDADEKAHW
ncbi:hypothetical protein ABW20_dc0100418 [Dactylellina cionopaga]|nr:hypothetical protein ABW20_dc0100418 [Dactylellina cionopaga]